MPAPAGTPYPPESSKPPCTRSGRRWAAEDTRTAAQRRMDGLTAACQAALNSGTAGPGTPPPPPMHHGRRTNPRPPDGPPDQPHPGPPNRDRPGRDRHRRSHGPGHRTGGRTGPADEPGPEPAGPAASRDRPPGPARAGRHRRGRAPAGTGATGADRRQAGPAPPAGPAHGGTGGRRRRPGPGRRPPAPATAPCSPPGRSSPWPAAPASRSSAGPAASPWTSAAATAPKPPPSAAPSKPGTGAAGSPAAACPPSGPPPTTSVPGKTAAPPASRTTALLCFVHHHYFVHLLGWTITGNPNATLRFTHPSGWLTLDSPLPGARPNPARRKPRPRVGSALAGPPTLGVCSLRPPQQPGSPISGAGIRAREPAPTGRPAGPRGSDRWESGLGRGSPGGARPARDASGRTGIRRHRQSGESAGPYGGWRPAGRLPDGRRGQH